LEVLNDFLLEKYSRGHRAVLIVDEAQNLSAEALEEIRMISNLQTDKDLLLQVILVGQPGLKVRLQQPSFSQLTQRIVVSYHLSALSEEETRGYILHRLRKSGCENEEVFTADAIAAVYRHSRGIPRTINLLCDAALVYGFADESRTIDTDIIAQVVKDRTEMGILGDLQAQAEIAGEQQPPLPADPALLDRLQGLEEKIARLAGATGRQSAEGPRQEDATAKLVSAIDRLLERERERNEKLMGLYMNLATSIGTRPEPEKPDDDFFSTGKGEQRPRVEGYAADPRVHTQDEDEEPDPSGPLPGEIEKNVLVEGPELIFSRALDKHEKEQSGKTTGTLGKTKTVRRADHSV
jgi:hypothetical protein